MSDIQTLQPHLLWKWFDQICAIPHPSYEEEKLAQFILQWAQSKGFYAERDEVGNLLIRKPATSGMENCVPVALQAHFDMVPQANEGYQHNFSTDPILPYIEGEWVKAKGTTLGADNGIGLASTLAVLDSDDLAHPPLEVLLTMTEEAGMEGAIGLRPNWLKSETMINTDTEDNGEIYIGCAGGENANIQLPIEKQLNTYQHQYQISLKGLSGGHSGCDIHTGRANAIKVLLRFLADFCQNQPHFEFVLSELRGGSVRNAIPREAFASLAFNQNPEILIQAVNRFENILKNELAQVEPSLYLTVQAITHSEQVFSPVSTKHAIHFFNALPNGVIRNSDVVKDVVESSLSIGILSTEQTHLEGVILIRSLIESGNRYVASLLQSLCHLAGAKLILSGYYPGWEPVNQSRILTLTEKIYGEILGYAPQIKVIHAGLECGLLKKIYPNMEMISIGPTIRNAHSPDEKVHIPAVQIYWDLLIKLLAAIPQK